MLIWASSSRELKYVTIVVGSMAAVNQACGGHISIDTHEAQRVY